MIFRIIGMLRPSITDGMNTNVLTNIGVMMWGNSVNNGELVPSARFNYTTLPKQEYRLAGWLYRSAAAPCRR